MSFFRRAIQLWFVLLLVSIAVDVACYWLAQHAPVPLPGNAGIDYIAIFLISAPSPFILALAIALVSGILALGRGLWLGCRSAFRPKAGRQQTAGGRAAERGLPPQELHPRAAARAAFAGKGPPH